MLCIKQDLHEKCYVLTKQVLILTSGLKMEDDKEISVLVERVYQKLHICTQNISLMIINTKSLTYAERVTTSNTPLYRFCTQEKSNE